MLFSNERFQEITEILFFLTFSPLLDIIRHYFLKKLEEKTILAKEEVMSTAVETSQHLKSSNLCSFYLIVQADPFRSRQATRIEKAT